MRSFAISVLVLVVSMAGAACSDDASGGVDADRPDTGGMDAAEPDTGFPPDAIMCDCCPGDGFVYWTTSDVGCEERCASEMCDAASDAPPA